MFGVLKGLFYFFAFLSAYFAVPVLWYLPRMRVQGPEGTSYRLCLAGRCLVLMGALGALVPIIEIRDGELPVAGLLLALGIGGAAGLVAAAKWTRRWERELRDRGRIESNIRKRARYTYLALAAVFILELHLEQYSSLLPRLRIVALCSAMFFFLVYGGSIWLWASGIERATKHTVEIFFRRTGPGAHLRP